MSKKSYLTAKYDSIFKNIFCDEDNPKLLIKLLESILNIEITNIKFLNNELKIHKKDERTKRVDGIFLINEKIYCHIEVNSSHNNELTYRNSIFFYSIIVSKTLKNENYNLNDNFIHISFTYGLGKKYGVKEEYRLVNTTGTIVRVKNIKEIEFNMDKIKAFWYNEDKEKLDKYKYLLMQNLNKEELEKLSIMYKGDETIMDYNEKLRKLNENGKFNSLLTEEEEEIFWRNTERNIGEKRGKKDVAKNMLNDGVNIDLIAKYTNLTKQQIVSLK